MEKDKQIIIDVCPYQGECSVSGCKRNDDGCFIRNLFEERYRAENQIVELNKKVEAKEQECETLASQLDFEVQKKECLEQECEELKFQNKRLDEVALYWHKRIFKVERSERKLKQTLTEIKEIIHFNKTNRLSGGACISIEQILQKISECEVE